jgi:hypothetical protein
MVRFVSIVTSDFWPGFAALLQSLSENSGLGPGEFEFVAICDVDRAPHAWLQGRSEQVRLIPLAAIPVVSVLSPQSQGKRMENALQKLGIFALRPEEGPYVYIDVDMVCLSPIREIAEFQPITAGSEVMSGFDTGVRPEDLGDVEINTGLLVFQPEAGVFDELQETYRRMHDRQRHKGDQDVINVWARGRSLHRLGAEWNFSKRFQEKLGLPWIQQRIAQVKILHFVGVKPWTSNREIRTVRECRYRWLEEIWWDYFERSGFAAHMDNPPKRSIAFARQMILPYTKPVILLEHATRFWGAVLRRLKPQEAA